MDIRKLQRAIVDGLEHVKAHHIVVFNTEHLSPLFERVVIASGTSNRQTKALAASVRDAVKSRGMQVLSTEGEANGEWIIVDCGAAVVHVMQPAIRTYYNLEEIWGDKPVKIKLDTTPLKLVKAAKPAKVEPARAAKLPAKKAKVGTVPALRAAAVKPAPAGKTPAKRKPVAAKKAVTRTVGAKRSPRAKPVARKAGARKTAPRR
jgi:ribosome-associated protein